MSPRSQILKLKLAAMRGLNPSFDADCDGLLCSPAFEYLPGELQFSCAFVRQLSRTLLRYCFPLQRLPRVPDILGDHFRPHMEPRRETTNINAIEGSLPAKNLLNYFLPFLRCLVFHRD